MNAKDEVRELLDRLPDDVDQEDVLYHLYIKIVLERRLATEDPETVAHEDVVEEFRRRWPSLAR